jgi:WhiB family redox-sensing transcriptional regulator
VLSEKEKAAMSMAQSEQVLFGRIRKQGDWPAQGVCREIDPDLWFPDQGDGGSHRKGQGDLLLVPGGRRVQGVAISSREPFGIWGGLSPRDREKLRKAAA